MSEESPGRYRMMHVSEENLEKDEGEASEKGKNWTDERDEGVGQYPIFNVARILRGESTANTKDRSEK